VSAFDPKLTLALEEVGPALVRTIALGESGSRVLTRTCTRFYAVRLLFCR